MKKRTRWGIVLVLSAMAILLLTLGAGAQDETPTVVDLLLSDAAAPCDAVKPHVAAGAWDSGSGRHYLAATWIQRRNLGESCASGGQLFLRWARPITQANDAAWSAAIDPLQGILPSDEMVIDADVAVFDSTAHIVAITRRFAPGGDYPMTTTLRYVAYDLSSNTRISQAIIRVDEAASASDLQLLEASIAVGDDEVPHIAYSRRTGLGSDVADTSQVWYTRPVTGFWGDGVHLTASSEQQRAYHPQIAWSRQISAPNQGYVHIAWGYHKPPDSTNVSNYNGTVLYRRCLDNATSGGELVCGEETLFSDTTPNETHPRPTVAAQGDTVALIWNFCASVDPNPPCELLGLAYRLSRQGGSDFAFMANSGTPPYEVRSNQPAPPASFKYIGTDDEGVEYGSYLRPTAVISGGSDLILAWQVVSTVVGGNDAHYWPSVITTAWGYSHSVEAGRVGRWQDRGWQEGQYIAASLMPDIAMAPLEAEPKGGLHLLLMRSDDVGGTQRYRIYYTYFNDAFVLPSSGDEDEDPYPNRIYLPLVLRGR